MNKLNGSKSSLLPPVFKWVGFGIAVVAVAVAFVLHAPKEWLYIPIIAGLLTAMWSRERHDDEMMHQVRLKAAFAAISTVAICVIAVQLMRSDQDTMPTGSVVLIPLVVYHVGLGAAKLAIRRHEKHD